MKPRCVMARMSLELSFGSRKANTSAISVDWLLLAMGASPWSAACGATGRKNASASIASALSELLLNGFFIQQSPLLLIFVHTPHPYYRLLTGDAGHDWSWTVL